VSAQNSQQSQSQPVTARIQRQVEYVPMETCSGHGEAWHGEVETDANGVCPSCGATNVQPIAAASEFCATCGQSVDRPNPCCGRTHFEPGQRVRIHARVQPHIAEGPAREQLALQMVRVDRVMRGHSGIIDRNSPAYEAWMDWMFRRNGTKVLQGIGDSHEA
jgi:ribosomal protein L37AE/L43A